MNQRPTKPSEKTEEKELAQEVLLLDMKENPLFPEWLTVRVKGLHYRHPVPCAECGKPRKRHWTMLCSFRVGGTEQIYQIRPGEKLHPPLTPVCSEHLLQPEWAEVKKR